MNKTLWILAISIWITSLFILIVALTNVWPNNPFADYKLLVGLLFLMITGLLRIAYRKYNPNNKKIPQS